jgi:copper chaperone CopZ
VHVATDYIHALEGRLRIKVPEIKGSPLRAGELEKQVKWQPGIDYIKANPTTGNVLVYYDAEKIGQEHVLKVMQESGYLQFSSPQRLNGSGVNEAKTSIMENLVSSVAQSLMEAALTRLVTAII